MSMFVSVRKWLAAAGLLCVTPSLVSAQTYAPLGGEYRISGALAGDQVHSALAADARGAILVWQDNHIDGRGLGIGALRLDQNFLARFGAFKVNEQVSGDQENPSVALLSTGAAVFVWQGGVAGRQNIFARFLSPLGTFVTRDIQVNTHVGSQKGQPSIAVLGDDSVMIVWSSGDQDGSMQGVFGQRLSASGEKIGTEFQVNQLALFNQRSSAITRLSDGRVAVAWISEQNDRSVNLFARLFSAEAQPAGSEFRLNSTTNLCANPSLAPSPAGGFRAAWSTLEVGNRTNGWDVATRAFDAAGIPVGIEAVVNTYRNRGQYSPKLALSGADYLIVWTSVGQDKSREGVFGQFVGTSGARIGEEFQVNRNVIGQQFSPTVAATGNGQLAVAWTSYTGSGAGFDLFGQRYAASQETLRASPPFVAALSQTKVGVSWPIPEAFAATGYELYVDDNPTPMTLTANFASVGSFAPGSVHAFSLVYVLGNGEKSARSEPTTATTWGNDDNFDGIPDDWQQTHFGVDRAAWPSSHADSDGDGASNLKEFLAGTDPKERQSVLHTRVSHAGRNTVRITWNTQPGLVYQVQTSDNMTVWNDLGTPRFAPGLTDSILNSRSGRTGYYRVVRLR